MSLDKVLGALGKFFIGGGILVFLFVAYQVWGTGITEARQQARLQAEAKAQFANLSPTTTASKPTTTPKPGTPTTATTGAPAPPPTPTGSAVAVIKIPKINVQKAVVEGTGVVDLKKGPGHYLNTPLPGQQGNAAIAGHRTTYGAPFSGLGELVNGDEIDVTTSQGTYVYRVDNIKVVDPSDTSVLKQTKDARLTLTTCHPKYSAAKRLVISAVLAPGQKASPAPPTTTTTSAAPSPANENTVSSEVAEDDATQAALDDATLSGTATSKGPAIIWGFLTFLVGLGIYIAAQRWRRWTSYLIGAPFFLIVLFVFFENFARLLPANA